MILDVSMCRGTHDMRHSRQTSKYTGILLKQQKGGRVERQNSMRHSTAKLKCFIALYTPV